MDYRKKAVLKVVLGILALAACIALVVIGQRKVGMLQLGMQLGGLAGVLVLLHLYNRGFNIIKVPNFQNQREDKEG